MALEKKDQRVEIRLLQQLGLNAKGVHDRLVAVHGCDAVSRTTVQR